MSVLNDLLSLQGAVVTLIPFFLGLLLGNRLALGRDRRKERNAASRPIRTWLLVESEKPCPNNKTPSVEEMDQFLSCLPRFRRRSFQKHLDRYHFYCKQYREVSEYVALYYTNIDEIRSAAQDCLRHTKRA